MQRLPIFRAVEILIVLSVVLFFVGNFTLIAGDKGEDSARDKKVVLGENSESESATPTPEEEATEEKIEVKIQDAPSPTPTTSTSDGNNPPSSDFIYPGSIHISGSIYESLDPPDVITEWYKERIVSRNMNVRTFVTTKTNGNVLNKLGGARGDININIEIEKKVDNARTRIIVR